MCNKCRIIKLSLNLDDLEPELRRIAKLIYRGQLKPGQIDTAMVKRIADQLMTGVIKGYAAGEAITDLTAAQRSFITQLQENIYVFSGFKTYQQLKEASLLMLDNEGSYRSFNQFFQDVKKIDATYNEVYAEAEYNNVFASSQNARSWHDYIENGVQMLEFQTAGDERVRDNHRPLNGMIVPIGDPLLDKYYTPLDWGCRCEWIPAPGKKPTGYSSGELPVLKPMFSTNIGKTGIIFPDTHPYFNVPEVIKQEIISQVAKIEKTRLLPDFTPPQISSYEKSAGVTVDKQIFSYLNKETPLTHKAGGGYYHPDENRVNIPLDKRRKDSKWYAEAVIYHEYGHAADWQRALKDLPAVKTLMAKYKDLYKDRFAGLSKELYEMGKDAYTNGKYDVMEQVGAVADTIMSLNKRYGFGHKMKVVRNGRRLDYFDVPGYKEAEFIAHTFENRFAGNEIFERFMPDLYEDMRKLADELAIQE